jgi:putative phosphoribosyl transferase
MQTDTDFDTYLFEDRDDALKHILSILPIERMKEEDWFLLSLSRGGVEMTSKIATELGLYFDIILVEPILAQNNQECEIAMVSETQEIVINKKLVDSFGISLNHIYDEATKKYNKNIIPRIENFRKGLSLSELKDRHVLLIDEGCETGLSILCALKSLLNADTKKVSLALPIIADDLYCSMDMKVDKVYACHRIKNFIAVDYYYKTLEDITTKEIKEVLGNSKFYYPFIKGENE